MPQKWWLKPAAAAVYLPPAIGPSWPSAAAHAPPATTPAPPTPNTFIHSRRFMGDPSIECRRPDGDLTWPTDDEHTSDTLPSDQQDSAVPRRTTARDDEPPDDWEDDFGT